MNEPFTKCRGGRIMRGTHRIFRRIILATLLVGMFFGRSLASQTIEQRRFNEFNMQPEVWHFVSPQYAKVDAKGDLRLSIPILTVPATNGLDFQINFTYKAGILYHQTASWIGLGWNFDPGSITRDVSGGLYYYSDYNTEPHTGVDYERLATRLYMPDMYYLFIPKEGTIPMMRTTYSNFNNYYNDYNFLHPYNGEYGFYLMNYRPYKIEYLVSDSNYDWPGEYKIPQGNNGSQNEEDDIIRFIVTTDDGTRYIYGLPSLGKYKSYLEGDRVYYFYPNAWRLLAIAGPDFTGDIEDLCQDGNNLSLDELEPRIDWIKFEYEFDNTQVFSNGATDNTLIQNTYLKKIITPTHYVVFITGNRSDVDLRNYAGTGNNISGLYKRLKEILLYTRNHNLVMKVKLVTNYELGISNTNGKLTLKQIYYEAADGSQLPGYEFTYGFNPIWRNSTAEFYYDGWGYYNESGIPSNSDNIDGNLSDAAAWALQTITYPSGSVEKFYFENDKIDNKVMTYYYIDQGGYWSEKDFNFDLYGRRQGGIRVKKIVRTDGMGDSLEIDFQYGRGYAPCIPPKQVPWISGIPANVDEYQVYQRGNMDIVYEWIEKIYPDGSREKTYYYIDTTKTLNTLLSNYKLDTYVSYHVDNQNIFWGLPIKKVIRQGDFTDST